MPAGDVHHLQFPKPITVGTVHSPPQMKRISGHCCLLVRTHISSNSRGTLALSLKHPVTHVNRLCVRQFPQLEPVTHESAHEAASQGLVMSVGFLAKTDLLKCQGFGLWGFVGLFLLESTSLDSIQFIERGFSQVF